MVVVGDVDSIDGRYDGPHRHLYSKNAFSKKWQGGKNEFSTKQQYSYELVFSKIQQYSKNELASRNIPVQNIQSVGIFQYETFSQ